VWDSLARALLFLVTLSLLALRTDTAAQYVKNFEDFKIKEKKNPIPAITRDLQFNVDYINNPCLLAPTAEVAPLMAIDELQRQYKETRKPLLSQEQLDDSKMLYHKIVLEGYLLMACMIRVEFGSKKAETIIDTWLSGYNIPGFKQVIEDDLKSVLDIADSAVSAQQCRHWVVMATRYNEFQVPSLSNIQIVSDYLTDKLSIGGGSLAKVGPYTGSIIKRCLQTKLEKGEKERASALVGVGQQFSYQLLGAAMPRILGHHSSADLLRILAHELNRASKLEREEVRKRVRFLVSGFKLSEMCRRLKSDQDCLEAVEADFSAHTPAGDHILSLQSLLTNPHLDHPVTDHPVLLHPPHSLHNISALHPLLGAIHKPLPQLTLAKPGKPSPGKVGVSATTNKVGQQPLTHKPGGNLLPNLKIGADHPGISVSEQTDHTALLEHGLNHHITGDWPLDVHPEHLTSSADELINKVNNMDSPLITAIIHNKNPGLLKLLQDSGNPELFQKLLNSQVPIMNENAINLEGHQMSSKEQARLRLKQLLQAFKGDKQRLSKAIKARAKQRLLLYLRNHRNAKLLSLMKMKYKEPLMAELGFHGDDQAPQLKMHSAYNLKERPKAKAVTANEILRLLKLQHGKHNSKFHSSQLRPGNEILDELKEELGSLGFKHKQKQAEYIDNTLVHFAGVGLPIQDNPGDVVNEMKHHNPFQYEEDWKGSMWSSKKHNQQENPQQLLGEQQQQQHNTAWILENGTPHLSTEGVSEKTNAGQQANSISVMHNTPGIASIDESTATFGNVNEENTNKENLKNVLKYVSGKGADMNDAEILLSNLPGIIGHQVNKQEVNNMLAQFGKKNGEQYNSVKLPATNYGKASPGEQLSSYTSSENVRLASQDEAAQGLPIENVETIQKQLQPQKIVEQVELSSTDQNQASLSSGPVPVEISQMSDGDVAAPSMESGKAVFGKEGQEDVVHIAPSQKEIHIGPSSLQQNSETFTTEQLGSDNYAGVTENEKPRVDLLNLNGKLEGLEGLDSASDTDGDKAIDSLLSNDAVPTSQTDQETMSELKEQAEFDKNALTTVHRLASVKPTTINTNYLESFDNDDVEEPKAFSSKLINKPTTIDTNYLDTIDRPLSSRLSNRPTSINTNYLESLDSNDATGLKKSGTSTDVVDDYMNYIHKQDAVNDAYAKQFYKNNINNPMAMMSSTMFENEDYSNFDKKTLKSKSKTGRKAANKQLKSSKNIRAKGKQKLASNKKQDSNFKVKANSNKNVLRLNQKSQSVRFKKGGQETKHKQEKQKQKQISGNLKATTKKLPLFTLKKTALKGKHGLINKIVEVPKLRNKNKTEKGFQQRKAKENKGKVNGRSKAEQLKTQKKETQRHKSAKKQTEKRKWERTDRKMSIL